jgi:hypothetical protein
MDPRVDGEAGEESRRYAPKYTKGKLRLAPKNKEGQPLQSKVEALDAPRDSSTPISCRRPGTTDKGSVAHAAEVRATKVG